MLYCTGAAKYCAGTDAGTGAGSSMVLLLVLVLVLGLVLYWVLALALVLVLVWHWSSALESTRVSASSGIAVSLIGLEATEGQLLHYYTTRTKRELESVK